MGCNFWASGCNWDMLFSVLCCKADTWDQSSIDQYQCTYFISRPFMIYQAEVNLRSGFLSFVFAAGKKIQGTLDRRLKSWSGKQRPLIYILWCVNERERTIWRVIVKEKYRLEDPQLLWQFYDEIHDQLQDRCIKKWHQFFVNAVLSVRWVRTCEGFGNLTTSRGRSER